MILKSLISLSISMALMPQLHGGDRSIIFSSKIEKKQKETLKSDLDYLSRFNFALAADQKTLELMEINDLNSQSALGWLYDRVSVVIEDTPTNKLKIKSSPFFTLS